MREQFISTGKQCESIAESMRAQARLFRNLGDNVTAEKWEKQAQVEQAFQQAYTTGKPLEITIPKWGN